MTPTEDDVKTALAALGGTATASSVCDRLTKQGFARDRAQLAIQRATDGERVIIEGDWRLRLAA